MRKWMDKEAAKAEGCTPAPRGVLNFMNNQTNLCKKNVRKKTVICEGR